MKILKRKGSLFFVMIHLEAIFVAILVFTCFVHGNVFYVSVSNGVDSGTCGNQTTPCISISSALIVAKNDFLQTGNHSTIFVESGIYQEPQLLVESPVFLMFVLSFLLFRSNLPFRLDLVTVVSILLFL